MADCCIDSAYTPVQLRVYRHGMPAWVSRHAPVPGFFCMLYLNTELGSGLLHEGGRSKSRCLQMIFSLSLAHSFVPYMQFCFSCSSVGTMTAAYQHVGSPAPSVASMSSLQSSEPRKWLKWCTLAQNTAPDKAVVWLQWVSVVSC